MKMKETFCSYTDFSEDDTKKIREEMEELKNELDKTRNIVRVQRVRYQQLVSLFSAKLQEKEEETRNDLQIKHIQLTRILRALYILEAKLRKEQRYLKSTLIERDGLIRTQQNEITKLKKELENRCENCVKLNLPTIQSEIPSDTDTKTTSNNKPDLISSIGIEMREETVKSKPQSRFAEFLPSVANSNGTKLENDENTYVIASLDDYDASLSSLRVRGTGAANETKETFPQTGSANVDVEHHQNANNENLRNRIIDEKLQNEMRKFKMKHAEEDIFDKAYTPRMILKQVTENPTEKLNGPVLKCVEQILSVENEHRKNIKSYAKNTINNSPTSESNSIDDGYKKHHPTKPPKPNFYNKESTKIVTSSASKIQLHVNTSPAKLLPNHEENQKLFVSSHLSHNELLKVVESVDTCKRGPEYCERIGADESKIVQTVSTLLSDSDESEDEKCELSPTVSQMVKKFEGLKCSKKNIAKQGLNSLKNDGTLQTNFEEFHLVDKEIESTCEDIVKDSAIRLEAEGEENNIGSIIIETTNVSSNAKYEAFLEVTGLSQKSILTPSRILSNHRNVVKPKDVKYRNRVKSAVIGEKCANGSITSPTMKYWTEPYL